MVCLNDADYICGSSGTTEILDMANITQIFFL